MSRFTTNSQNVLPTEAMHAWTRLSTDCRKELFQRSQDGYECFARHQKHVGKVFLHFKFDPNALGILRFPHK